MPDGCQLLRAPLASYHQSFCCPPVGPGLFLSNDLLAAGTRVPYSGTILNLGCRQVHLANLPMLGSPARTVLGIAIDPKKLPAAQRIIRGRPNIQLLVGDAPSPPDEPYQALTIADVLYFLPTDARRHVLVAAFQHLVTEFVTGKVRCASLAGGTWLPTHSNGC